MKHVITVAMAVHLGNCCWTVTWDGHLCLGCEAESVDTVNYACFWVVPHLGEGSTLRMATNTTTTGSNKEASF